MDKISVIVPVYKAEKYLDACVSSIVHQTYPNLEIILVDDGSPDNCGALCDAWAEKDSRVRVIHQENAGGGPARNAGLDLATGEFIAFVDSDDYISAAMYETMMRRMDEGVDIVECGYQEVWDSDTVFPAAELHTRAYTTEEAMQENIRDTIFRQLIWNKLYRREVVEGVRFPAGTRIDDEFFTYRVLGNAKKLVYMDAVLYAYRQQEASLMHSMGAKRRAEGVEAKLQRHQYLREKFPALVGESLKNLWFACLYQGQLSLRELEKSEAAEVLALVEKALRACPLSELNCPCSGKEKLWLHLAEIRFKRTCQLRNMLKIGL